MGDEKEIPEYLRRYFPQEEVYPNATRFKENIKKMPKPKPNPKVDAILEKMVNGNLSDKKLFAELMDALREDETD